MCLLHNSLWSPRRTVSPKVDSNRNQITFVFLSSANILGVLRLGFIFSFNSFFSFLFFLNRPLLQIVDLEKKNPLRGARARKVFPELQARSVFMVHRATNWLCRRPFPTMTHGANHQLIQQWQLHCWAGWLTWENKRGQINLKPPRCAFVRLYVCVWVGRQVRGLNNESPADTYWINKSASAASGKRRLTCRPDALADKGRVGWERCFVKTRTSFTCHLCLCLAFRADRNGLTGFNLLTDF